MKLTLQNFLYTFSVIGLESMIKHMVNKKLAVSNYHFSQLTEKIGQRPQYSGSFPRVDIWSWRCSLYQDLISQDILEGFSYFHGSFQTYDLLPDDLEVLFHFDHEGVNEDLILIFVKPNCCLTLTGWCCPCLRCFWHWRQCKSAYKLYVSSKYFSKQVVLN